MSKILPWIAENLVNGKPWYGKFYEFRKSNANDLKYEKKGLISMTDNLQPQEKTLFDSVQGAFSVYLVGQNKQAAKQGRPLDYPQVTDKVIHRLQRPSTQQEFATALVDFLSQFRSKAAKGLGREIYAWIHGEEWRKARDLTMLAIATYQGKKKDGDTSSEEELVEVPDSDSVAEADDEGYEESL
jgi:CRISPR-associated protein Cas8a1/Csx13